MAKEKEEQTKAKMSKKKLLIMAGGGGGLVVVLGVVLGVVFMGGEDEPQETQVVETHEPSTGEEIGADQGEADGGAEGEAHDEGASAQAMVAQISGASSYVFDDAFVVNVHDSTGRRYLNLIMEIETVGPQVVIEIKRNVAPLRDAIIMLLSSKTAEELGKVEGKLKLKQEIIFRIESILEPGSIEAVYFTEFNMLVL